MNIHQQRLELLNPDRLLMHYQQSLEVYEFNATTIKREIAALKEFITWWQSINLQSAGLINLALIDQATLQAFCAHLTRTYPSRSDETIRRQAIKVVRLIRWATRERLIIPDASLEISTFELTPKLRDLIYTYHQYLEQTIQLQPVTIDSYIRDLKEFIGWWQVYYAPDWPFDLKRIDKTTLDAFKEHQTKFRQLAQTTIRRQIISIRRILEWALEQQIITSNPTDNNAVPYEIAIKKVLSRVEEERLHKAVQSDVAQSPFNISRARAIIALLLYTGLRTEELLDLTFTQIEITDKAGVLKNIGKLSMKRNIPLNPYTRSTLARHLYTLTQKTGYVFTSIQKGVTRQLTPRSIQQIVSHYGQLAQISNLTPTILRHSFGYRLALAGAPVEQIAQIMGYTSFDTAQRYIKLANETLKTTNATLEQE